jgi:hypothetical protein
MLADPQSQIIRRFGLFNEEIDPTSRDYGIPYPATLLVDGRGVVQQKILEEHYIHRLPAMTLLLRLGKTPPLPPPRLAQRFDYLEVLTAATETTLYPGNPVTLFVDIKPQPGVHVYAPGVSDYQGVAVTIEEQPYLRIRGAQYPPSAFLHIPILEETVAVYDRPVRISIDLALGNRLELQPVYDAGGTLEIEGTLAIQACDDRVCYPPQEIPLRWTFPVKPPDLERPPEALRHQPKG